MDVTYPLADKTLYCADCGKEIPRGHRFALATVPLCLACVTVRVRKIWGA